MKNLSFLLLVVLISFTNCSKKDEVALSKDLTIFFVNDQHGQLDNFSKIKHIVDAEKQVTNVIVACSGDTFSGNPVVDNYAEKGYPMIDVMNRVGFDISVIGNHEFDYGEANLKNRMEQAEFVWVCANVDMGSSVINQPLAYKTINVNDISVTFLGLVETDGKQNGTIPSTHPWKVTDLVFERPESVISQFADIKEQEDSDLYVALTHIGHSGNAEILGDYQLAEQFPYFDLIIGGHTHQTINSTINNIPIFQSGSYLNYLGKIELSIIEKKIESINYDLIELNSYTEYDSELKAVIDGYNDAPLLNEVIGYSHLYHEKSQVGCFYTDALLGSMNVDVSFQNSGGIRSDLDEGDITRSEIFEIAPFNNGTVMYDMSVLEIKDFLKGSASGFYYSGIQIDQIGEGIQIMDPNDNILADNTVLSVGINDYIPTVHEDYFPTSGDIRSLSAAETIISYLENVNAQVNYTNCDSYFGYPQ